MNRVPVMTKLSRDEKEKIEKAAAEERRCISGYIAYHALRAAEGRSNDG